MNLISLPLVTTQTSMEKMVPNLSATTVSKTPNTTWLTSPKSYPSTPNRTEFKACLELLSEWLVTFKPTTSPPLTNPPLRFMTMNTFTLKWLLLSKKNVPWPSWKTLPVYKLTLKTTTSFKSFSVAQTMLISLPRTSSLERPFLLRSNFLKQLLCQSQLIWFTERSGVFQ